MWKKYKALFLVAIVLGVWWFYSKAKAAAAGLLQTGAAGIDATTGNVTLPAELVQKIRSGTVTTAELQALGKTLGAVVAAEVWLYGFQVGDNNVWTQAANGFLSWYHPGWNNVPADSGQAVDGESAKKAFVQDIWTKYSKGKRPGIWASIPGVA